MREGEGASGGPSWGIRNNFPRDRRKGLRGICIKVSKERTSSKVQEREGSCVFAKDSRIASVVSLERENVEKGEGMLSTISVE